MSRAGDDGLGSISDDDLIEVQVSQSSAPNSRSRSVFDNLLHPRGVPSRARPAMDLNFPNPDSLRPAGSHSRRSQPAGPSASQLRLRPSHQTSIRRSWARTPAAEAAVIDLTEEPDSPVERRRTQPSAPQVMLQQVPHNIAGRHPRRTNSQRISPPQLSRSDSTFVGQSSFIDLTADSPEDEQRSNRDHWRTRAHPRHHHRHHHHEHLPPSRDRLVSLDFISSHHHHQLESDIRVFGRTLAGFLSGSLSASFGPELQTMFPNREPTPKPPMEPVPPARTGFTRDTRADSQSEQLVVVCPACNEELAYDPTEAPATPSKKRKRAAGEHHFWALKKCGHVSAANRCFSCEPH